MAFSPQSSDECAFYDFLDLPHPFSDALQHLQPLDFSGQPVGPPSLDSLSPELAHSVPPSLCSPAASTDSFPPCFSPPTEPATVQDNFDAVLKQFGLDFASHSPVDQEPLVVNAKQYHRILKRRATRAQQAVAHKMNQGKKGYKHESRHKHAVRRPRGPGGRFLTAEEIQAMRMGGESPQED